MTLALTILAAVWVLTTLLVVSLCQLAKRGDDAQAAVTTRSSTPPQRTFRARSRGAQAERARAGSLRR